ncbi:MAG: carboxypeptidase M32 [Pseudomonadales bacterium]|nr:carboxypeptidase M32 [Pseudomonadales bacterium]
MKNAYEELTDHFCKIGDLQHVYAITSWDEAAMMPSGGGEARGKALATLGVMIHELTVSSEIGDWLDTCSNLELDEWQQANLREIRREYESATCLPSALVRESSLAASKCEQAWRSAREDNDWNRIKPLLEDVVAWARESATVRSEKTGLGKYDSLLETFEPGMRSAKVDELFAGLKTFLPEFAEQVIAEQACRETYSPGDHFPVDRQRDLGLKVMQVLGFDFEHGRLDVSHHPFCGGVKEDVRITTRYTTDNFFESLMAVIHETGHAMYEQGRPEGWDGQPVGVARSMGVHESQSLMMEMQAGRSKEFISFLAPVIREVFGASGSDPAWSAENLHHLYVRVERGLIRVDADEVTYPLHVILRYEIEKALIEGEVEVTHIPDLWDEKMMTYLKRDTRGDYKDGCLQDVHWHAGLFGYFPTYTLGAMMAAQQFAAAKREMPDILDQLSQGNVGDLLGWVRKNIHQRASLYTVSDLMTKATGEDLNEQFFVEHLKARYLPG